MKIQLLYFSGTGNTEFISKRIQEQLKTHHTVELLTIESVLFSPELIDQEAILGLGYPVYDFMPPRIVIKALEGLKSVVHQKAFIFSTYTSSSLDSNYHAVKALQSKGYHVLTMTNFKAPGASSFIYSNPSNFIVKTKTVFEKELRTHMNEFVSDVEKKINLPSQLMRIKFNQFNKVHQSFSKTFFGILFYKNLKVNEDCNQCGICVKSCPEKNLELQDKLVINNSNDCMKCLRCVQSCPNKAINFTSTKRRGDYSIHDIKNAFNKLR